MFARAFLLLLCTLLAGCGDPLAGLDRLGDVELSGQDQSAAALPTEAEVAREGFFGTSAAAGAGVTPAVSAQQSELAPAQGLRGVLRRVRRADPQADAVAAAVVESESNAQAQTSSVEVKEQPAPPQPAQAVQATNPPVAQKGFFGRLLGRQAPTSPTVSAPPVANAPNDSAAVEPVELASRPLGPEDALQPARRGLFGLGTRTTAAPVRRSGPDARDVEYGATLPFGEIARSCASRGRPLGRKVERAPANGYTLFDTKPDSAAPRTFYITGFDDGCPRQLTAANVLLGSASLYERLHYGPGGENLPRAATDEAYEKVKRQVCGSPRRKPCGAQIRKMDRNTFFVSAYSRFGNANSWSEVLIHDGTVLAAALKSYN